MAEGWEEVEGEREGVRDASEDADALAHCVCDSVLVPALVKVGGEEGVAAGALGVPRADGVCLPCKERDEEGVVECEGERVGEREGEED